jgi:hypothetical protein
MQSPRAPKHTRKAHHPRHTRCDPYLLDEIAFTRSDIERARAGEASAA